jgi:hypothetical protein
MHLLFWAYVATFSTHESLMELLSFSDTKVLLVVVSRIEFLITHDQIDATLDKSYEGRDHG